MDQIAMIVLIVLGMIASYFVRNRFGRSHQDAADLLGMRLVKGETLSHDSSRPGEVALMRGEMFGLPTMLFITGLPGSDPRKQRRMLKARTHLAVEAQARFPTTLILEPVLPEALYGASEPKLPVVETGDEIFDRVFRVSSKEGGEALRLIDEDFRRRWLEFRKALAPQARDDAMSRTAVNLLMGRLEVEPDRLVYSVRGTPNKKVADHLKRGVELLADVFNLKG